MENEPNFKPLFGRFGSYSTSIDIHVEIASMRTSQRIETLRKFGQ